MKGKKIVTVLAILLAAAGMLFVQPALAADSECISCHTDASRLMAAYGDSAPSEALAYWAGRSGSKPEPGYMNVLIDPAALKDENHADVACEECHGGDPEAQDVDAAHEGVVKDPSFSNPAVCTDCHEYEQYEKSPHFTAADLTKPVMARAGENFEKLGQAMSGNCLTCHSSCGQCHISRPETVGGGLISGHKFVKNASMDQTCLACHGSRIGDEFTGRIPGLKPDLHYERSGMTCQDCHNQDQMHGADEGEAKGPACLDCHKAIYNADAPNKEAHNLHKGRLSCQVCHSQPYTNCYECHLNPPVDGKASFQASAPQIEFKIGLNPDISESKPEKMVLVRRVPAVKDGFKAFAENGLPNFDQTPYWVPSSPHNIRLKTPQNGDCNNCHGMDNKKLYLLLWDVPAEGRQANRPVIVAPGRIPNPIVKNEEAAE